MGRSFAATGQYFPQAIIEVVEQAWPDAIGDVEVVMKNCSTFVQYTSNPDDEIPEILFSGITTETGRLSNVSEVIQGIWEECEAAYLFEHAPIIDVKFWIPDDDGAMKLIWKRLTEDGIQDSSRVAEPTETEAEAETTQS